VSPVVIGLTGGIASGKSTVARALRARGAAVVDADELARRVVEPGQPALAELTTYFGTSILTDDGRLDRKALGARVFADPVARARLGQITHPRIAALSQQEIARHGAAGAGVVFYEAALLIENKLHTSLAATVVVAAEPAVQRARMASRDGLSPAEADARLAAQLPLADKRAVATWVIDNDGDEAALAHEIERVVTAIEARFGPIAAAAAQAGPSRGAGAAAPCVLVTGFPAFTARRLVRELAGHDPTTPVRVLARAKFGDDAARFAAEVAAETGARVEVVTGDVCDMDLGLPSGEYLALTRSITTLYHLAGAYYPGLDAASAQRLGVGGTRGALDLAADCAHLQRMIHWSSALVAGKRRGVVREDELVAGQAFHNAAERTKFEAERLVAGAAGRLPITIVRPSLIVGDSVTGEIDRFDGPYYLLVLIATNSSGLRLPLPGRGDAPLNLVPIDYVIDATRRLAADPRARGRTVHLTDPEALPARRVFELVAQAAGTPPPRASRAGGLTRVLLRAPGLAQLARAPRAFVDRFDRPVYYDTASADELLAPAGLACPRFERYVGALVRFVLTARTRPGFEPVGSDDDVADALA
jgi:dephospho-CoA kinase